MTGPKSHVFAALALRLVEGAEAPKPGRTMLSGPPSRSQGSTIKDLAGLSA